MTSAAPRPPWSRPLLWSLLTFAILASLTGALSFAAARMADASVRAQNTQLATQIGERIRSCMINRIEIIGTMQRERALGGLRDDGAFAARAQALTAVFPGYLAINWIDQDGVIVRVYPQDANRKALGQRLLDKPSAAAEIRRAIDTRQPMLTGPLELFQGGKGVALYVPPAPDSPSREILNGVFRTESIIPACLRLEDVPDHSFAVTDGDAKVFERAKPAARSFASTTSLPLLNRTWTVHLAPSVDLVTAAHHPARILLSGGLALSTSVAVLLFGLLTGRARAQANARSSEDERRRLVSLVDAAHDYVAIIRADGTVEYLNPTGRSMAGLEADGSVQLRASDMVVAEDLERLQAHAARTVSQGSSTEEVRIQNLRTGAVTPVELHSFMLGPAEGKERSRATVGRDLRERRKLEVQLQQAQKMEALGRLAGGVAHDFNNLLSVILIDAELLRGPAPPHERQQLLDEILDAGQRAAGLTKELLALGRGRPADRAAVNLGAMVLAMRPLLARLVRSDIELEVRADPEPTEMLGSRVQLEQIVVNLVMNAVDAMPKGGTLTVQVAHEDHRIRLSVEDTGEGVPPEILPHVFEPFFTTKGAGSGTGLGLATVYGNVGRMSGDIRIESPPGRGACFVIRFPVWSAPAGTEEEASVTDVKAAPPHPRTVLLVEDSVAVRTSMARMLRRAGVEVEEVEHGEAAIARLESAGRAEPDIILSDVVMPRMGGVELLAWVRAHRPHVPMVLMSGYSGDALANVDIQALNVTLLDKPISEPVLLAKLAEVLARSRRRAQASGAAVDRDRRA